MENALNVEKRGTLHANAQTFEKKVAFVHLQGLNQDLVRPLNKMKADTKKKEVQG